MILIDMPMPERCESCPCSYWIRTGKHTDRLMCQAMEARGNPEEFYIVDEWMNERPENCPIVAEV